MDMLSINTDIKPTNVTHKQYFRRNKHSERNTIADFQICWPLLIRQFQIRHVLIFITISSPGKDYFPVFGRISSGKLRFIQWLLLTEKKFGTESCSYPCKHGLRITIHLWTPRTPISLFQSKLAISVFEAVVEKKSLGAPQAEDGLGNP